MVGLDTYLADAVLDARRSGEAEREYANIPHLAEAMKRELADIATSVQLLVGGAKSIVRQAPECS
jgi:hypothetical protein